MPEPKKEPQTEPTPFERFELLARKVVNTPKSVVERDKKQRRERRAGHKPELRRPQ